MQPNNQETCLCSAGIESMIQFDVVVLLLSFRCVTLLMSKEDQENPL